MTYEKKRKLAGFEIFFVDIEFGFCDSDDNLMEVCNYVEIIVTVFFARCSVDRIP